MTEENLTIHQVWSSKSNRSVIYWPVFKITEMGDPKELVLVVYKDGILGYIPLDESGVEPGANKKITKGRMELLIGQEVPIIVKDVDESGDYFGASIKYAREKLYAQHGSKIKIGETYPGIVRRIQRSAADLKPRAVIVEVLGIECVMPLTEIAYGWITEPEEYIEKGQSLQVKMLQFDKDNPTQRPVVSRKALLKNPWNSIDLFYKVGDTTSGRVTGIRDHGVQLALDPGISAFVSHPKNGVAEIGDTIQFYVTAIHRPTEARPQGAIIGAVRSLEKRN